MSPNQKLRLLNAAESAAGIDYLYGRYDVAFKTWCGLLDMRIALRREVALDRSPFRYLMHGWTPAIGHIALIDFYVKSLRLGLLEDQIPFVMPRSLREIANPFYLRKWREFLPVITNPKEISNSLHTAKYLEIPIAVLQLRDGRKMFYSDLATLAQEMWEEQKRSRLMWMTWPEHERGKNILHRLIPKGVPYVTLHVREAGFHKQEKDHTRSGRNASIDTYLPAIEALTRRGYFVLRMGDKTMGRLPRMKGVVDYAHSRHKSDFMDIFLLSDCDFYIGTNSGVSFAAGAWGRRCLYTNWMPLGITPWHRTGCTLLTKHYSACPPETHTVESTEVLARIGVTVKDNTPEELESAAIAMVEGAK